MLRFLLCVLLIQPLVAREGPLKEDLVEECPAMPVLECRIRAVHKGVGDELKLKISLENLGEAPLRVMMPNWWYDMSAGSMIGGWEFKFIGPDGEPAKLDWGIPPPDMKSLCPREERTLVLRHGEFIGMTLPIKGQLADLEKVSKVVLTYWVMENYREEFLMDQRDYLKKPMTQLWEGKVVSNEFNITAFMNSRPKKK